MKKDFKKNIMLFFIIFLISSIMGAQNYTDTYEDKIETKIITGEIKIKGFLLSLFTGEFSISIESVDGKINKLSIFSKVGFSTIERFSNIEDLKKGKVGKLSLNDGEDILIQMTPINFNEGGGTLKFEINTLNGIFYEILYLVKDTDNIFKLYKRDKLQLVEVTDMNLVLIGNILNISKIKIKSYNIL